MKTMKKSLNSRSNFLQAMKNIWFACQLLIVSISLPVMSFLQMSYKYNPTNVKQTDKVISSPLQQNQTASQLKDDKTIWFS
jgi:hypothetical protein